MHYIKLVTHQVLVTKISSEVIDLALFLEIPHGIEEVDDHIYIVDDTLPLALNSFHLRRGNDVMVSSKVFCEILMDIVGGLTVLEAYNKQGYTFNH